jgi:hypothetical protein
VVDITAPAAQTKPVSKLLLVGWGELKPYRGCSAGDLERQGRAARAGSVERQLEIMTAAQRTPIGHREQITGAYPARGSRSLGIDVAHEQPGDRRQPDGAALGECDRSAGDDQAELWSETIVWIGVLERVEQLAQQPGELLALPLGLDQGVHWENDFNIDYVRDSGSSPNRGGCGSDIYSCRESADHRLGLAGEPKN